MEGALAAWRSAHDADPRLLDALLNLGRLAARSGHIEEARSALGTVIERTADAREKREAREALQALGSPR